MADQIFIPLNRGSNLSFTGTLTLNGTPEDITGWTFTVVETTPAALADNVTCTVSDGPAGQFTCALPWSAEWPAGKGPKASIRIKPSGMSEAFPELLVDLQ